MLCCIEIAIWWHIGILLKYLHGQVDVNIFGVNQISYLGHFITVQNHRYLKMIINRMRSIALRLYAYISDDNYLLFQ